MIKNLRNQTIALAGLSQAVCLVQQIAHKGHADPDDMESSIASALRIDADDVIGVYGGLDRIAMGLRHLEKQLGTPDQVDAEQARYASVLIFLERKLMAQPGMIDSIRATVQRAAELAQQSGVLAEPVLEALAEGYQETVSRLKPRVMVVGEQIYLSDPDNAHRIRSLLLAGIRSVVLWRQCGGSRWRLLFRRTRFQKEVRLLLQSL